MARDFFTLEKGIHVTGENSDVGVKYLFGSPVAGGTTETDGAEVGSLYIRTATGHLYQKITAGSGTDKWMRIANLNDLQTFTWRPEKVTAATGQAAPSSGSTIDLSSAPFSDDDSPTLAGADFTVDDYIIFGVGGTPKLMRVSVVAGDVITVVDASSALVANNNFVVKHYLPDAPDAQEKQAIVHYDGTNIIKLADFNWELATGIKLSSGYSAVNGNITTADTVESAIQKLDGNQQDIQSASGLSQGAVNYGSFSGSLLADNQTSKQLFQALETEAEAVRTTLGTSAGATDMGAYTGGVLTDNASTKTNIQELSNAIEDILIRTSVTGITTTQTVDQVLVDNYCAVIFEVCISLDSDPSRKQYLEVRAIHNGTPTADATTTDDDVTHKLKTGTSFDATVAVDLNGTGVTQYMRLRIGATSAVSVKVARRTVR